MLSMDLVSMCLRLSFVKCPFSGVPPPPRRTRAFCLLHPVDSKLQSVWAERVLPSLMTTTNSWQRNWHQSLSIGTLRAPQVGGVPRGSVLELSILSTLIIYKKKRPDVCECCWSHLLVIVVVTWLIFSQWWFTYTSKTSSVALTHFTSKKVTSHFCQYLNHEN